MWDTRPAGVRTLTEDQALLADRKVQLNDADLEALAIEEIGGSVHHAYEFVSLEVRGGTASTPTADLVMRVEGEEVAVTCEGDGMVDASCSAVKQATGGAGVDGYLPPWMLKKFYHIPSFSADSEFSRKLVLGNKGIPFFSFVFL